MKRFILRRPDGSLVNMQTQDTERLAFFRGSIAETPTGVSGEILRKSDSFGARCWRASRNEFEWSEALAYELGLALGYKAVLVSVNEDEAL